MGKFRSYMAIDMGTSCTLVYTRAKGVLLNEPSIVAQDTFTEKIVAVGEEAKRMLGRTPGNIKAKSPLENGVIADYPSTEKMLDYFIHKTAGKTFFKPDVVFCVPSRATQVQNRALVLAAQTAGAHSVFLIEQPLAAALGSGFDIGAPGGNMVVDIGGGSTDIAVISMGTIVVSHSLRLAGMAFDQAIKDYVRHEYGLLIGDRMAEDLKIRAGSLTNLSKEETIEARGRSLMDGLPKSIYLGLTDITQALEPVFTKIIAGIQQVLSYTPPELSADLNDHGILLTGGGSLVRGLDNQSRRDLMVKIIHGDHPLTAAVRGTGMSLNYVKEWNPTDSVFSETTRRQILQREGLRRR